MRAYCLEFQKRPPAAGTVFAVAPTEMQTGFKPAHIVFRAAEELRKRHLLGEQGSPTSYFHSIRQWAWWTREQKFTSTAFLAAFVEYTHKNLTAAKQPWTQETEAYIR